MNPESSQEQAALYVLGLLDAEGMAAFEQELESDAEMRKLVAELRDATSTLAEADLGEGAALPPPGLRGRVLAQIADETARLVDQGAPIETAATAQVVATPRARVLLPWALAACLLVCCGILALSRARWQRMFSETDRRLTAIILGQDTQNARPDENPLRDVIFCPLQPVRDSPLPQTAVLWDAVKGQGELHITHLALPRPGEDYQLWVVEEGKKEPVSAGVVKLDAAGDANTSFRPLADGRASAFAVSIEKAGGSPKNEGPIVFLGKL